MISQKRLEQLKKMFKEDFGVELTDDRALEIGLWLVSRARAVARKIPEEKAELFGKIKAESAST